MAKKCNKDKFVSGKKEYIPFSEAKKVYRELAKNNDFQKYATSHNNLTLAYARWIKNNKDKLPSNVPSRPAKVYSKSNVSKNRKNCIDISKSVYY